MDETKPKLTWRDAWRMVFRRRRMFVLGASLIAIVVLIASPSPYGWELKYTGTTIFHRYTDPAAEERAGSFESIKLTLEHELYGREAVKEACEELGLTRGFERGADGMLTLNGEMAMRTLVEGVMKNMQVRWTVRDPQVDLLSVSFTHDEPDLAQSMPNTLVRKYIAKVHDMIVDRLDKSLKFLKERVSGVDTRFNTAMKQQIDFEAQHHGMLPDSPGALQQLMQLINTDIDTVRRQQLVATQKLERLKALAEKAAAAPGEPIQVIKGPNPELARLKEKLREYQEQLQDARTLRQMTPNHPTIKALQEKIAEIKKQIEETPEEIVIQKVYGSEGPGDNLAVALAAAQSEVETADKELERLQARLNALLDLLANYGPVRQRYDEIRKKVAELETEKANWQVRLTGVQMALEAEVAKRRTHLEAVQMAEKQFLPSSPKLLVVLGFALAGGLAFGGGVVFLCHTIDRSISTKQDAAKHFNLPVCGVIDEILTPWQRRKRRARQWGVEPLGALILVAIIGVASLNIVLWLQHPEHYQQWKKDPPAFIKSNATYYYQRAVQELKGRFP